MIPVLGKSVAVIIIFNVDCTSSVATGPFSCTAADIFSVFVTGSFGCTAVVAVVVYTNQNRRQRYCCVNSTSIGSSVENFSLQNESIFQFSLKCLFRRTFVEQYAESIFDSLFVKTLIEININLEDTKCIRDLDMIIIFGSLLTTFEESSIF